MLLFILKANNKKPKCEIVLKANNLFILFSLKPSIEPIINESNELTNRLVVQVYLKEIDKELLV